MKKVILFASILILIIGCKKRSVKRTCCTSSPYIEEFEGGYILMPNIFTPNGDGINDEYGPIHAGLVRWEMQVFDTKDREVYSTTTSEMWNGGGLNDMLGYKITYHTVKAETGSFQGVVCVLTDTEGICPKSLDDCVFGTQADRPFVNFDTNLPSNEVLCVD